MICEKKNTMVMNHPNEHFSASLPILKNQNYENWCKQINIVFCYQDLWDLVKEGVTPLATNVTNEEKAAHKELKKKDYKALFIIHQCVDADNFEKVSDAESAKEAWEILEKSFGGAEKVKEVRLQTHKRTYELLQMEDNESITDFSLGLQNW